MFPAATLKMISIKKPLIVIRCYLDMENEQYDDL